MRINCPGDLLALWRERVAFLKENEHRKSARMWERAIGELDQVLRALGAELLTLPEAAALCGYSADYLGTLVRTGKIRNYGRKGSPRIRRADLPVKSSSAPGRPKQRAHGEVNISDISTKLLRGGEHGRK